jgi:hypothetical protein
MAEVNDLGFDGGFIWIFIIIIIFIFFFNRRDCRW